MVSISVPELGSANHPNPSLLAHRLFHNHACSSAEPPVQKPNRSLKGLEMHKMPLKKDRASSFPRLTATRR